MTSSRHTLSDIQIKNGLSIPKQEHNWNCGINSIARMFAMMSKPYFPNYKDLVNECPRSFGFGPLHLISIGPIPSELTKFANSKTQDNEVSCKEFPSNKEHFPKALDTIRADINDGRPVIALVGYKATALHYITIIGFNDELQQLSLMDTNGAQIKYSYDKFQELMLNVGKYAKYYFGVLAPCLYLIRICPKEK